MTDDDDSQPKAGVPGFPWASSDNELSQFLVRRERELIQQTAALRGALQPKEKELEAVRLAMKAVGLTPNYVAQLQPFLSDEQQQNMLLSQSATFNADNVTYTPLTESLTIKQMIQQALVDHFHQGATPSELSEYMRTVYGRDVDRNSISPQLARLRDEGKVSPMGMTGKWQRSTMATVTEVFRAIAKAGDSERRRGDDRKDD